MSFYFKSIFSFRTTANHDVVKFECPLKWPTLLFFRLPPFFRRISKQQQSNKLLSRKGVNKIVYQRLIWFRYSKFCLIDKTSWFKLSWKYRWVLDATYHYSWFGWNCIYLLNWNIRYQSNIFRLQGINEKQFLSLSLDRCIVLPNLSWQDFFLQPVFENHKRNDETRVEAIKIRLNQCCNKYKNSFCLF